MHGGHEHDHSNGGGGPTPTTPPGVGHNRPIDSRRPLQWQTPQRADAPAAGDGHPRAETDLDLVEAAFVEGFLLASDATSFLRLARVPFECTAAYGSRLALLRVEGGSGGDGGSIT